MTSVHARKDPLCDLGTTVAKTTVGTGLGRLDKSCQRHCASGEAGYARILMRKNATQTFKICCSLHEPMQHILNTLPLSCYSTLDLEVIHRVYYWKLSIHTV